MEHPDVQAWQRLGRQVARRRAELRLNQNELHSRGGPSHATVQSIEAGRSTTYRDRTLLDLERSLGWTEGSVATVLAGGEPTIAESAVVQSDVIAAVLADPNLPPEAKQHLTESYRVWMRAQAATRVPAQPLTADEAEFVATGQADLDDAPGSLHLVDDDRNCQ